MTKDEAVDLIKDAGYGFLATMDGNQARVRPVGPYLTDEGLFLLALLSRSRSIQQIGKNPQIELCFVDRKMAFCRLSGKAQLSKDSEKREIVFNNVPTLRQFASGPQDPIFTLMEIKIESAEAMTPNDREPQKVDF